MALTELAAKQAKSKDKDYKLTDEKGLFLLVKATGAKYWRLKYRHPQTKKERLLALGVYPETGLKQARKQRQDARKLLDSGIDPSDHKKAHKAAQGAAASNNFEAIANEWFARQEPSWAAATAKKQRAMLDKEIIPFLRTRPIADIETWELVGVLDRIVKRDAVGTAQRTRQVLNAVCRYAKQTGRAQHNPAADLAGTLPKRKVNHRAAITDPVDFANLLIAIDNYQGSPTVKSALKLSPLLFCRPGELRHLEWAEINWQDSRIEIPAEKMKMREPHVIPLAPQAIAILKELELLTGRGKFVFPSVRGASQPLSENGVRTALRTMGYDNNTMTPHGFRASARTMLDEVLNERVEYIEHQLAHAVKDANGNAYNRTKHLPERAAMMNLWADYLENLKIQAVASNVITANFGENSA